MTAFPCTAPAAPSARAAAVAVAVALLSGCAPLLPGDAASTAAAGPATAVAIASPGAAGADDCPRAAADLAPEALYGRWEARFDGAPDTALVEFSRHPEYAGSVRGTLRRPGASAAGDAAAQLAGDVDDAGVLTLDESGDGRAIDAVWSAELDPASCGTTFRGTRRASADDRTQAFVLHRTRSLSPLP